MFFLTPADIDDLKALLNHYRWIYDDYQKLASLEASGKKDSNEYQDAINSLRNNINIKYFVEDRLFKSDEKLVAILNYLKVSEFEFGKIISLDFRDQEQLSKARLVMEIYKTMLKREPVKLDYLEVRSLMIYYTLLDIVNLGLTLIDFEKSDRLKVQLTEAKYQYSYILSDIEANLMNQDFNLDKNPYVINTMIENMVEYNLKAVRFSVLVEIMKESIINVIKDDIDFINPDLIAHAIINKCIIRACLILAKGYEKDMTSLVNLAIGKVKSSDMKQDEKQLKISLKILEDILVSQEQDKEIPRFLETNIKL